MSFHPESGRFSFRTVVKYNLYLCILVFVVTTVITGRVNLPDPASDYYIIASYFLFPYGEFVFSLIALVLCLMRRDRRAGIMALGSMGIAILLPVYYFLALFLIFPTYA